MSLLAIAMGGVLGVVIGIMLYHWVRPEIMKQNMSLTIENKRLRERISYIGTRGTDGTY